MVENTVALVVLTQDLVIGVTRDLIDSSLQSLLIVHL